MWPIPGGAPPPRRGARAVLRPHDRCPRPRSCGSETGRSPSPLFSLGIFVFFRVVTFSRFLTTCKLRDFWVFEETRLNCVSATNHSDKQGRVQTNQPQNRRTEFFQFQSTKFLKVKSLVFVFVLFQKVQLSRLEGDRLRRRIAGTSWGPLPAPRSCCLSTISTGGPSRPHTAIFFVLFSIIFLKNVGTFFNEEKKQNKKVKDGLEY